jgi:putative peptidoglycan lipid II flippase
VRPEMTGTSRKFFHRIGPGAIGAGAGQINMLLSTILASTLPTGAVSCLSYADRLEQLPLGIVGIAVSTTLLPLLSRHVEAGAEDSVRHYTSRALEFCIMLGLPAAMGFILLALPIVQTLFQHGAFGAEDARKTAQALAGYALGIPAFLLVKVFAADFFARHDTKTPVKMAIAAMITNVVCALALLGPLQHIGIAIASSIALWTNAGLLFMRLRRRRKNLTDARWRYRLPRLLLCSLAMSLVTLALTVWLDSWFVADHLGRELAALTLIIAGSGIVYASLLQITGAMRWGELLTILRRGDAKNMDRI